MTQSKFGDCCEEMRESLVLKGKPLIREENNGVLYMAIGYLQVKDALGWYDRAVIFCPFCGKKIQDKDKIKFSAENQ